MVGTMNTQADGEAGRSANQMLQRVGHCLYRSQKSGVYYAILKRTGKQIKRSLKTTDHVLARRRLAEFEQKAARLNTGESSRISFADLSKRWLEKIAGSMKPSSHFRQSGVVKKLNEYLGPLLVRGISKGHVEKWASQRSQTRAARTFNYERETLVRILDYAVRDGLILDNPARVLNRLRQPQGKAVIPTKDQFRKLLEAIGSLKATAHDAADLCELLAYSGCRLGEATALRWGDIDFEARQFTITGGESGTKNHEVRTVPLFPALERCLRELRETLAPPPNTSDRICPIDNAKKALISACRMAELPHFTHHHLRHFFCSNAIEAGVDFKAIAGWLGHKDGGLLVARTYGHLRDEHSVAMAQRMTFDAKGT
jgi:integrase